ncbi:MAG: HPP family protein [Gammaproteobacteria bacterium]
MANNFTNFLGIETQSISHKERIISGIGAFLGIYFVYLISQYFLGKQASVIILASMGSSAVLLFAVPHGNLSQPWALVGGHVLSAIVGVSCVQLIDNQILAASCAVGLAVTVMHYARCTHPPGGATALGAVLGGPVVHQLGYQFVITPVLLNTMIILFVAISFNALFKWRRYPVSLNRSSHKLSKEKTELIHSGHASITHEDFVYALSQIDTFIDVDESDLLTIYELATKRAQKTINSELEIRFGGFYSNGEYGDQWSVRKVEELLNDDSVENKKLRYKVVAGQGRRRINTVSVDDFRKWARYEVYRDEDNWRKVEKDI